MRWMSIVIVTLACCGTGSEPPAPTSGSPMTQLETAPKPPVAAAQAAASASPGFERAQALFSSMCATCHGIDGRGDGPVAANLTTKPRDYSDPQWQASVTDEYLQKVIVEGGKKNNKSPLMPGNPDLANKPEVLDGLVQIIRSFKK